MRIRRTRERNSLLDYKSMYKNDTIAAIATGMGKSAIGMIRVSGPEAIAICDTIFTGKKRIKDMDTFTAAFGRIMCEEEILDEAVVLVMKGPHTFTTEDTVEIDLHGGPFVMKRVLELLISKGIRVAEPGEFTKRAFLGGRIDMSEAEAVMDVISAESDMALRTSVNQLTGRLKQEIVLLREKILYNTAYIESALDDPENYSLDGFSQKLEGEVKELNHKIDGLLVTTDEGRIIREGIRTAIIGRPNAGKSSILNMLLGENRAIVTDTPGTTRDTLEEFISLDGIVLKLIDTAGIRDTADVIERMGVERARECVRDADLLLVVIDGSDEITEDDREILRLSMNRKSIILINKNDKDQIISEDDLMRIIEANRESIVEALDSSDELPVDSQRIISISAKSGDGLELLKEQIREIFFKGEVDYNNQLCITNARHKQALINARESLNRVLESIDNAMGEDFLTIDLMAAYEFLGQIIGETLEDDLADKIFSEFCMGK